jgi:hypothetical protein
MPAYRFIVFSPCKDLQKWGWPTFPSSALTLYPTHPISQSDLPCLPDHKALSHIAHTTFQPLPFPHSFVNSGVTFSKETSWFSIPHTRFKAINQPDFLCFTMALLTLHHKHLFLCCYPTLSCDVPEGSVCIFVLFIALAKRLAQRICSINISLDKWMNQWINQWWLKFRTVGSYQPHRL